MPRSASRARRSAGAGPAETSASQSVDVPLERDRVQLAAYVLAERREPGDAERLPPQRGGAAARHPQAPDLAAAVVAEEVASLRGGDGRPPVDGTARHRAAAAAALVDGQRPGRPPATPPARTPELP